MSGVVEGTTLTVVIHLPQPISAISAMLAALSREFPGASIDTNRPDGWIIEVMTDDR